MRRVLTRIVIAAALAVLPTAVLAHIRTHVHDVRVGAHEGYDRVVVELDGAADIAWERGPEPNAETFYLDADLGRRERQVATQLAEVGTVTLRAMRVGTTLSLEPRERRVRAYLLAKPTRLVIDIAPPGPGAFEVPAGLTALAPATSVESLKSAPVPEPKSEPEEAEPEPEPAPAPAEEVAPEGPPPEAPAVAPKHEPLEGAVESQPSEPSSEMDANAPAPAATTPAEEPATEATAPESAPAEAPPPPEPPVAATPPTVPPVAPIPAPTPEGGFPWLLVLAAIAAVGGVGWLGLTLGRDREQPAPRLTPARARPTPLGVDAISLEELRRAADPASRIEQRLDDEVRARVALEEKLAQAGEELKVLRDRLHRIERKRDEPV
jgi:hypothetical protein